MNFILSKFALLNNSLEETIYSFVLFLGMILMINYFINNK